MDEWDAYAAGVAPQMAAFDRLPASIRFFAHEAPIQIPVEVLAGVVLKHGEAAAPEVMRGMMRRMGVAL